MREQVLVGAAWLEPGYYARGALGDAHVAEVTCALAMDCADFALEPLLGLGEQAESALDALNAVTRGGWWEFREGSLVLFAGEPE